MPETGFELEQQDIYNNGSYVRIEEDQMTAWLYLAAARKPYTKEELYDFLKEHGVVKGYHTSNIAAMAKKRVYEREIKAAEGKTNENGEDGYFEYTFCPEMYTEPKVLEDGSVDYTSMKALQNVQVGEVVAVYHQAKMGEDGYTVTGIERKAQLARNLPQRPGTGVELDEETGEYKAAIEGKVEILNDRVDVRNVHEVRGDVDLITGRIDFVGDVIIWGNVETGVSIHAARNIEIHGSVEAADLTAGGDIILSRGIQGAQKAHIVAKGNIFADFIEHTTVKAGGNVKANSIMNSKVMCNGKVVVTGRGRRGTLIGGYTHGLQGVEVTTMGNEAEVRTIVHTGYLPEDQKKYFAHKKEETDMEQNLADTIEEQTTLQRNQMINGNAPNLILERRLAELSKEKEKCYTKLAVIRKNKALVSQLIEMGKGAKIIVDGNIYRGSIVCIDALQTMIEHNTCYMRYFSMGGRMESNVIIK